MLVGIDLVLIESEWVRLGEILIIKLREGIDVVFVIEKCEVNFKIRYFKW